MHTNSIPAVTAPLHPNPFLSTGHNDAKTAPATPANKTNPLADSNGGTTNINSELQQYLKKVEQDLATPKKTEKPVLKSHPAPNPYNHPAAAPKHRINLLA